jgi:hypothetical protein
VNTIPHPDIPARSFSCPQCSAQHSRGTVNGVDVYRCLKCGWSGRLDKKGRAILPLHCPFCGRDRTGLLDVHGEFEHVQVHCLHWPKLRPFQPLELVPQPSTSILHRVRVFGEDSVVKLRAEGYQSARRVTHQELEAMARREWREHLAFRRGYASWGIVARVEALERRVNTPVSAEVAA